MAIKKRSEGLQRFMESVFDEMASTGTYYNLENLNGVIDRLLGSNQNKTEAKALAEFVFDRGRPWF